MPTAQTSPETKFRRRRPKMADEIIETLRQDIVTRRLPDGERLPSEKELSDRFGVSQPSKRWGSLKSCTAADPSSAAAVTSRSHPLCRPSCSSGAWG